jgi:exonuclease VII small subunit
MPSKRKPPLDPRIAVARERIEKATESFERWYGRMKRAVTAMEKCRRTIQNAQRRISRIQSEQAPDAKEP